MSAHIWPASPHLVLRFSPHCRLRQSLTHLQWFSYRTILPKSHVAYWSNWIKSIYNRHLSPLKTDTGHTWYTWLMKTHTQTHTRMMLLSQQPVDNCLSRPPTDFIFSRLVKLTHIYMNTSWHTPSHVIKLQHSSCNEFSHFMNYSKHRSFPVNYVSAYSCTINQN